MKEAGWTLTLTEARWTLALRVSADTETDGVSANTDIDGGSVDADGGSMDTDADGCSVDTETAGGSEARWTLKLTEARWRVNTDTTQARWTQTEARWTLPLVPPLQLLVDYVSKQRVFVTSFWARPWKLTDKSLRTRAKRFIRRLRRHGHSFLDTYYYLAKYDR